MAFIALTLLVGQQEGCPACKNWVVRYWRGYLSGTRCKWFAYGPADAITTLSSLAPVKSRLVYLFGAGLLRLSWKKRLLHRCSSSSSSSWWSWSTGSSQLSTSTCSRGKCCGRELTQDFYGPDVLLPSNQKRQSTEGNTKHWPHPAAWPHPFFIHCCTVDSWLSGRWSRISLPDASASLFTIIMADKYKSNKTF